MLRCVKFGSGGATLVVVYLVSAVVDEETLIHRETSHGPFEYAIALGLDMYDWFRVRIAEDQLVTVYVGFEWDLELTAPVGVFSEDTGVPHWRLNGQRN